MYFWRIELLKAELRRGPLAQHRTFPYILVFLLVDTVLVGMPGLWNSDATPPLAPDWVGYMASVFLVGGGTYVSYRANGGRTGVDFPSRYFSVSWVLMVRLFILLFFPFLLVLYFIVLPGTVPTDAEIAWLATGALVVLEVVYYWRLARHMRSIAVFTNSAA